MCDIKLSLHCLFTNPVMWTGNHFIILGGYFGDLSYCNTGLLLGFKEGNLDKLKDHAAENCT